MGTNSAQRSREGELELSPTLPALSADMTADQSLAGVAAQRDLRAQLRLFAAMLLVAVVLAGVLFFVVGGDPLAKWLLLATIAGTVIVYSTLLVVSKNALWYGPRVIVYMGFAAFLPTVVCLYYFGVASPYPMVTAFGIYTFTRAGPSAIAMLPTYLACAIAHGLLAGLIIGGVIEDVGLISTAHAKTSHHVAIHIVIQIAYAFSYTHGVLSNRATKRFNADLERAVRKAAQRDALLAEARLQLEQAAGVGQPGPYSAHVLGSFRLGNIIGRGAMGEVYEAHNETTGTPAAVKVLHGHLLGDQEHRVRFAREAQATTAIDSTHVVSVLEVSDPDSAVPYLAMERLRGQNLAEILRDGPALSTDELVAMIDQLAEGLEAARVEKIVHRDLKPQNIFRCKDSDAPKWKILDFGVSKMLSHQATLTGGALLGTPAYMAPEQAASDVVDHRTDVYALGAICYRILTGRPPFSGTSLMAVMHSVVETMPAKPQLSIAGAADVELVLATALCKERKDRFASAVQFAAAFRAATVGKLDANLRAKARLILRQTPWAAVAA